MTPAEHRDRTIARFRSDAAERFSGVALDRLIAEISEVERVWMTLDHEPRSGKGVPHEESQAAFRIGCIQSSLRRLHPQDDVAAAARRAVESQAERQVRAQRLQAERRARPPSPAPVRETEPAATVSAQMSLFGD